MIISDKLLEFFIPALRGQSDQQMQSIFSTLLLEVESVKYITPLRENRHVLKVISVSEKNEYKFLDLKTQQTIISFSSFGFKEGDVFLSDIDDKTPSTLKPLSFSELFCSDLLEKNELVILSSHDEDFEDARSSFFWLPTRIYVLKQISPFWSSFSLFVLLQEILLILNIPHHEWIDRLNSLFEKDNSISRFLIVNFLISSGETIFNNRDLKESFRSFCFGDALNYLSLNTFKIENFRDNKTFSRPKSSINLTTLPPLFQDLRDNWLEVVRKLECYFFSFKSIDEKNWEITWPPWYSAKNLPSFLEILARLNPIDQSPRKIESVCLPDFEGVPSKQLSSPLVYFKKIREFLISKGFVECNTCKFIKKEYNLEQVNLWLSYSNDLTLRDNLHFHLVEVLSENLNKNNNIYPIFELSYCPWKSGWLLGLSSSVKLDKNNSNSESEVWYNLEEIQEFIVCLCSSIFAERVEFQSLEQGKYLPKMSATVAFNIVNSQDNHIGTLLVHRREQFELRKKELISVNLNISNFVKIYI